MKICIEVRSAFTLAIITKEIDVFATIGLGLATIALGLKGFTESGLPFTKEKNLTGTKAKITGAICISFGLAIIGFAITGKINNW